MTKPVRIYLSRPKTSKELFVMRMGGRRAYRRALMVVSSMLVLVALLPSTGSASPLYRIYGSVADALGRPLPGTTVSDGKQYDSVDDEGSYELPQSQTGTFSLRTNRSDLEPWSKTVSVDFPLDTRVDFELKYRFSLSMTPAHVTTAASGATLNVDGKSWAPDPGSPGATGGSSCVKVHDSRSGIVHDAVWGAANSDGSHSWSTTIDVPVGSAEAVYQVTAHAEDCAVGTVISASRTASYSVDNTPPDIRGLSPMDGHNTLFANQPIQANVIDVGPSGIAHEGVSFELVNETTAERYSLGALYNAQSGVATSTGGPLLVDGHDYTATVTARDQAGNVASAGHQPYLGPTDPRTGGFRKIAKAAESASTGVAPVSLIGVQPTSVSAYSDYVRIAVDVPVDSSTVRIGFSVLVSHRGPGPLIVGQAMGLRNGQFRGGNAAAHRVAPGGGVSASLLGSRVAVTPVGVSWRISSVAPLQVFPVHDDGLVELIVFVPDSRILKVESVTVDAPEGSQTTVTTGQGAHTVSVGDPDDEASPVTVNGVAVGPSRVVRQLETGITGAIVTGSCASCSGHWDAPGDGFSYGDWHLPGEANGWDNRQHFRGPAGEWVWTWNGSSGLHAAADGTPAYAAYVEVGEDWLNF